MPNNPKPANHSELLFSIPQIGHEPVKLPPEVSQAHYKQLQGISRNVPRTIRFRLGDKDDAVLLSGEESSYNAETHKVIYQGGKTTLDGFIRSIARQHQLSFSHSGFDNLPLIYNGSFAIAYSDNPAEQRVQTILKPELFFQGLYPNPLDTPKVYLGALVAFLDKDKDGIEQIVGHEYWWFNRGRDPQFTAEQKREFPIDTKETYWRFQNNDKQGDMEQKKGITETSIITMPIYLVPESDSSAEELLGPPKKEEANNSNNNNSPQEEKKPISNIQKPADDKSFEELLERFAPLLETDMDVIFDQIMSDTSKSQAYLFTLLQQRKDENPPKWHPDKQPAQRPSGRRGAVQNPAPAPEAKQQPTLLARNFDCLTLFFEMDKPSREKPHPFLDLLMNVYAATEYTQQHYNQPPPASMKATNVGLDTLNHADMEIFRGNLVPRVGVAPLRGRRYAIAADRIRKLTIKTKHYEPLFGSFNPEFQNIYRQIAQFADSYHANDPALLATPQQKNAAQGKADIEVVDLKHLLEKALRLPKDNFTWDALQMVVDKKLLPVNMPQKSEEWESLIRKIPHANLRVFIEIASGFRPRSNLPIDEDLKKKAAHLAIENYRKRYQAHMDALFCFLYTAVDLINNFCILTNINNLTPLQFRKLLNRLTFDNPDFRAFKNEYFRSTRAITELCENFYKEVGEKLRRENRNPSWPLSDTIRKSLESWNWRWVVKRGSDEMRLGSHHTCCFSHPHAAFKNVIWQDFEVLWKIIQAKDKNDIENVTFAQLLGPLPKLDPVKPVEPNPEPKPIVVVEPPKPNQADKSVAGNEKLLAASMFFAAAADAPTFAEIKDYLTSALALLKAKSSSDFIKMRCQKLQPSERSLQTFMRSVANVNVAGATSSISFQVDPAITKKSFVISESFKILVWLAYKFGHDQILGCKFEPSNITVELSQSCMAQLKRLFANPNFNQAFRV